MGDFFKFLWPSQNIWTLMVCLNQSKFQNAAFCPHIQKWIDFTHWNGIPFKLCSFLVRHSVCFGIICQNPIACPIVIVWHEMEKLQKKKTLDILMFGKKNSPFQRFNRPGRWNVGNTFIWLFNQEPKFWCLQYGF